jgi:large subunit ribosomal protein L22
MNGKAKAKYVRMSPRKVKLVLDKIRGKKVSDAYKILLFTDKRAAVPVKKTLASAVANAKADDITDKVRIVKAWVGQGPVMKRMRPRAMGRADIFRKPSSHIEIEVG